MRREYNLKNKINFVVIGVLSILIIIIFSLFIIKFVSIKTAEYSINKTTVLTTVNYNKFTIYKNVLMKLKFHGNN